MSREVVIGAGLSGLVRAHGLSRTGRDVVLLEASERVGGAVRTERREGFLLELGPNTVRPTREVWDLVVSLGLASEATLADRALPRYIEFHGSLHEAPASPLSFAGSRLLSASGKLRLLSEPFRRRGGKPGETVRGFFSRRLGAEAAERLVEPFVSGVWAGDASALAVAEAFPTLVEWERRHGSLVRGALAFRRGGAKSGQPPRGLLSFAGGLETLPRGLARELGSRLTTGAPVEEIARSGRGWTVRTTAGEISAASVHIATPAGEAARLLSPFEPRAADALRAIPHAALAVLHLAWPAEDPSSAAAHREGGAPRGFGHLVVPGGPGRLLGAVWSSSLFPGRAPAGEILFTAFAGGMRDPHAVHLDDAALLDLARRELSAVLGLRGDGRLLAATRYPRALPQYDLGHRSRMDEVARAERSWPGLSLIGNYRGGVSVGDVVRNAGRLPAAEKET